MNQNQYRYRVQVGVFKNYNRAMEYQMQLLQIMNQVDIKRQGDLYEVHVGDYDDLEKAALLEQYLRMAGFRTLLVAV